MLTKSQAAAARKLQTRHLTMREIAGRLGLVYGDVVLALYGGVTADSEAAAAHPTPDAQEDPAVAEAARSAEVSASPSPETATKQRVNVPPQHEAIPSAAAVGDGQATVHNAGVTAGETAPSSRAGADADPAASGWTESHTRQLVEMWQEGHSCSQIAAAIGGGLSRNAVIGKIHRMKLNAGRAVRSPMPRAPKPPRQRAPRQSRKPKVAKPRSAYAPAGPDDAGANDVVLKSAAWKPLPGTVPVALVDLQKGQCKWPIGDPRERDFGFCGCEAVPAKPYCPAHGRLSVATLAPAVPKVRTPAAGFSEMHVHRAVVNG